MSSTRSFMDGGSTPLPRPATPLIARDAEVTAVVSLLRDSAVRLLTLTGPGGVGKTRLALAAAAEVTTDFPHGVVFVDLSPVSNTTLVLSTTAASLGLRDIGAESLHHRLATAIADRRLLFVMDNFEQVVVAAPQLRQLLDACPEVTLLVTSRISLRVSGEREFPVAPLPLDEPAASKDAGDSGAVRLFIERARDIRPDFHLSAETLTAVTEIVRRVDGLPLAIELAAARTRALPPATLLRRLERRLPILSGGARDLPLRQQTMRDTIGWSYDLLDATEQALFRRLGVFVGGFTLEAAETVGADSTDTADEPQLNTSIDVLDGITALIEHSLIRLSAGADGKPRYQMLETVREYARDRLAAFGEDEIIQSRHAVFFLALAEATGWELDRRHLPDKIQQLEADHDNLRAALDWLAHRGEPEAFLRLARSLKMLWIFHGPHEEGRAWLEQALARAGEASPLLRSQALYVLGVLAVNQDDVGRAEACFTDSLALAQVHGDLDGVAHSWFGLGLVAMHRHQFIEATTHLEAALATARQLDDRVLASVRSGLALSFLGASAHAQGALAEATSRFEAALLDQRLVDHRWGIGLSLIGLGYAARDRGDLVRAMALFTEGLAPFTEIRDQRIIALALDGAAGVAIAWGQPERAARLLGAAMSMREADGLPVEPAFLATHDRDVAAVHAALGELRLAACLAEGAALPVAMVENDFTTVAVPPPGSVPRTPVLNHVDRFGLTPREVEVLSLLGEGMGDREIAETLSISERTAGNHVQHAMQKIGVDSRTAAAVFAVRHHINEHPLMGA